MSNVDFEDFKQIEALKPSELDGGDIVHGFDEWNKEWVQVQYRKDSNRFFDYPYTGAVWPIERMYKYVV